MGAPYIYDISRLRVKDLHSATYIYVVRRQRVNDGKLWTTCRMKLQCPTKSLSSDWWIWKLHWLCCITRGAVIVELFPQKIYLRKHSYSGAVGKYLPGHCDSVPTTRLLVYSTYRMTLFVHIQVSSVFVTYKRVVGS